MNAGWMIVLTLALLGAVYFVTQLLRMLRPHPDNFPTTAFLQKIQAVPPERRAACLGDSITQGDIGASYVRLVQKWAAPQAITVINAGINGDLSYTLVSRLDAVIQAQPAVVTILIGCNDVHASMSAENLQGYIKMKKIASAPSFAGYQENINTILRRLKAETTAKIALLSLTLISEDLDHPVNQRADQYSDFLRQAAQAHGVEYLPLREKQKDALRQAVLGQADRRPGLAYEKTGSAVNNAGLLHILGLSWDAVARRVGNHLSVDNLHSTNGAAEMIAGLVVDFMKQSGVSRA